MLVNSKYFPYANLLICCPLLLVKGKGLLFCLKLSFRTIQINKMLSVLLRRVYNFLSWYSWKIDIYLFSAQKLLVQRHTFAM